jgi:hypothetical protein
VRELKVNAGQIVSMDPCWIYGSADGEKRIRGLVEKYGVDGYVDAVMVANFRYMTRADRLWLILRESLMTTTELLTFAIEAVKLLQKIVPDLVTKHQSLVDRTIEALGKVIDGEDLEDATASVLNDIHRSHRWTVEDHFLRCISHAMECVGPDAYAIVTDLNELVLKLRGRAAGLGSEVPALLKIAQKIVGGEDASSSK